MRNDLLRFNGTLARDPAIDNWLRERAGPLGDIAQCWFDEMRACGDEVREILHDGFPTACLGDVPFAYVAVFSAHVNIGFFRGAELPDPARLLQGTGRYMRHVKVKPGTPLNDRALQRLIDTAYADIRTRIEQG